MLMMNIVCDGCVWLGTGDVICEVETDKATVGKLCCVHGCALLYAYAHDLVV